MDIQLTEPAEISKSNITEVSDYLSFGAYFISIWIFP